MALVAAPIMKQHDAPGIEFYLPDNLICQLIGGLSDPVARHNIHSGNNVARILKGEKRGDLLGGDRTAAAHIGLAVKPHVLASYAIDQQLRGVDFNLCPGSGHFSHVGVRVGMGPQLMTFCQNAFYQFWSGDRAVTQNKECAGRLGFAQNIQSGGGVLGVRTIIKGQDHLVGRTSAVKPHSTRSGHLAIAHRCHFLGCGVRLYSASADLWHGDWRDKWAFTEKLDVV